MRKIYSLVLMAVGLLISGNAWGWKTYFSTDDAIAIFANATDAATDDANKTLTIIEKSEDFDGAWLAAVDYVNNNCTGSDVPVMVVKSQNLSFSFSPNISNFEFSRDVIVDLGSKTINISAGSVISTNVTYKNGTIKSTANVSGMFVINNPNKAVTLTLGDKLKIGWSSASSYNLVTYGASTADGCQVVIDGNVTILNGNIYVDHLVQNPGSSLTMDVTVSSNMVNEDDINIGTLTISSSSKTYTNYGNIKITTLKMTGSNCKLINYGTITIEKANGSNMTQGTIENNNNASLTITDLKYSGYYSPVLTNKAGGELIITTAELANSSSKIDNYGTATIETLKHNSSNGTVTNYSGGTMTINKSGIKTTNQYKVVNKGTLNLTIDPANNIINLKNETGATCNLTHTYPFSSGQSTVYISNAGTINFVDGNFATSTSGYTGTGSILVYGGTFNNNAVTMFTRSGTELPLADGMVALPTFVTINGNAQSGVFVVPNETPYPCDASITDGENTYYFSTFRDAVAAMSKNATCNKLTLVRDVENMVLISNFTLPENTTIDLNQKKLFLGSPSNSDVNALTYSNSGKLTIKNGTIQYNGRQADGSIMLSGANAPTLELENVTFDCVPAAGFWANRAVAIASDGSVINCNGNTILPDLKLTNNVTVNIASTAVVSGGVESGSKTIVVNNEGKFTLNNYGYSGSAPTLGVLTINNEGTTDINNSVFNGDGSTSTLNINNISGTTTFINPTYQSSTINFSKTAGTINIQGGKYYSDVTFTGDATISGGMYKYDDAIHTWLDKNVDKTKYQIEHSKDGTTDVYTVGPAELFVVNVNGMKYSSLTSAMQNVPTDGMETDVILLNDCSDQITIGANQNVKLNLGEYTLTNKDNSAPCISVNGTLTIVADSLPDGTQLGTIDGGGNSAIKYTNAAAKVTINAGKLMASGSKSVILMGYVAEGTGGTLTINAGDFHGTPYYGAGSIVSANQAKNASVIVINGGTFDAQMSGTYTSGFDLIHLENNFKLGSLTIHGGLFTLNHVGEGTVTTGHQISCISAMGASCSLEITGGQFFNQVPADHFENTDNGLQLSSALEVYQDLNNVSITGGEFRSNGTGAQIYAQNANISLENAIFEGKNYAGLWITGFSGAAPMNINGGHFMGKYGIAVWNDANVTIDWCQCEGTSDGLYSYGNSTITLNGGNLSGENYGVYMVGAGTLNVKNVTLTSNTAAALYVGGTATAHVYETPIITSNSSYSYYNNGGTVAIDGGRFLGPNGTKNVSGTTLISAGIYNLDPIADTGCQLKDYEVIGNLDPSTKDVYPFTIGPKEFNDVTVSDKADRTIDWKTITTWKDENIIPDEGDDVTIADGKNVEVGKSGKTDAYAHQITVDNGSDLIIDGGSKLTVGNGGITLGNNGDGGEIIIKATAADGTGALVFSPVANEEVTTVKATIELRTEARKDDNDEYVWYYFGIPLDIEKGQFNNTSNWSREANNGTDTDLGTAIQKWDIVNGWQNVWVEALEPFKGFAITNNSKGGVTYTFKGKLLGNVSQNFKFTRRGFQFLANSYTAPMDIEALLQGLDDEVKATVYLFDSESNSFKAVSKSAFEGFIPPAFRTIPIMNGFFILMDKYYEASEEINYSKVVYNCNKPNSPLYAPARQEELDFSRVRININSATGRQDAMYLVENSDFTDDFENGYDEVKYMNSGLNVFANTTYGDQSAVFSDDLEGTIISMNATNDQVFTLSFDEQVGDLYTLTDIVTGKQVTMDANSTYTFTADAQHMGQRFMVTKANSISTDMESVKSAAKKSGIYSITGQYFGKTVNMNALPKGVYIINGIKVVK